MPDNFLGGVCDGPMQKRFLDYVGKPFVLEDNLYAFMISMDWLQPYKHLSHSVGAIYLSIFNLSGKLAIS